MTAFSGCDGTVVIPGFGNLLEISAFNLEETAETINTPVMDGTCANDVEASTTAWAGSMELFYDPNESAQGQIVIGATVSAEFYPLGTIVAPGYEKMSGDILITGLTMPVEANALVSVSVTFEGKGQLVRSPVT